MEYRVEELARAAGVRVDTVRFYQTRGLIPPPRRRGRIAIYDGSHLARVREVRELNRQGISLDAIRRLRERPSEPPQSGGSYADETASPRASAPISVSASLRAALDAFSDDATYSAAELSEESGFPIFLLNSVRELGLLEARETPEGIRYSEADRTALAAAKRVLDSGIPLSELLPLAREHAAHVAAISERAVELFEQHVRRKDHPEAPGAESLTIEFRDLLPAATRLVALHFQRALMRQARTRLDLRARQDRLKASPEHEGSSESPDPLDGPAAREVDPL